MSVIYHIYICVIYVCLSIGLSTYLSFYHSVCRSVYACLSINLSSVYLALSCFLVYLSVSLSCFLVCLSTLVPSLSVYLVFLSRLLCLPASLSVCQSVCLSWFLVCLFVFLRESIFFPCLSMHICLVYLSVCLAVCICLFLYSSISQSVFLSRTLEYRICSEPPPLRYIISPSPIPRLLAFYDSNIFIFFFCVCPCQSNRQHIVLPVCLCQSNRQHIVLSVCLCHLVLCSIIYWVWLKRYINITDIIDNATWNDKWRWVRW